MERRIVIAALFVLALPLVAGPAYAEDESLLDKVLNREEPVREPLPWEIPRPDEATCMVEELTLLRELRQRADALDARDAELDQREAATTQVEERLAEEMEALEEMRTAMLDFLERASTISAENVKALSAMVDKMKAREAAPMLEGMDEDVVLEVLRGIKPKQAAKILGAMTPAVSQQLADRFTLVPDPRDGVTEGGAP